MDKVPQTAWRIIDELKRNAVPTDKLESINHSEWYTHFSNLQHADNSHIDEQRKEQVISELNNYENITPNNANLNYEITENEITEASRKAQDLIKNKMIKSALPV